MVINPGAVLRPLEKPYPQDPKLPYPEGKLRSNKNTTSCEITAKLSSS
jgi:hypothetical protein